jgi:hypothetical protein
MAVRKTVTAKLVDFDREMAEINAETDVSRAEIRSAKYSSRSLGNSMREIQLQRELEALRRDAGNTYYLFLAAKKKHLDLQLAAYSEQSERTLSSAKEDETEQAKLTQSAS